MQQATLHLSEAWHWCSKCRSCTWAWCWRNHNSVYTCWCIVHNWYPIRENPNSTFPLIAEIFGEITLNFPRWNKMSEKFDPTRKHLLLQCRKSLNTSSFSYLPRHICQSGSSLSCFSQGFVAVRESGDIQFWQFENLGSREHKTWKKTGEMYNIIG